jgi:hypothetical protein
MTQFVARQKFDNHSKRAAFLERQEEKNFALTANTANTKNIINYKSDQQLNEVQGIKVDDDGGGRQ